MSLQTRLFAFFLAIVVVPLVVVGILGGALTVRELEGRTFSQLQLAQAGSIAVYQERILSARDRVQLIAENDEFARLLIEERYGELQSLMERELNNQPKQEDLDRTPLDYLVLSDPSGKLLAEALTKPGFLPGLNPPTAQELASSNLLPHRQLLRTRSIFPIRSPDPPQDVRWTFVGGYYFDSQFVSDLAESTGVDATVFIKGSAVSSTLSVRRGEKMILPLAGVEPGEYLRPRLADQDVYAVASAIDPSIKLKDAALVMSTPRSAVTRVAGTLRNSGLLLLFLSIIGAGLLGFLLARLISRPLREVAAGANAIAGGNYDQHIKVRSRDEIGQLARSFNEMTERLAAHIAELRESREQVKRAYARFGEILRSTHDLDRLLEGILDTSMDTLRAQRGALMLAGGRGSLSLKVGRGLDDDDIDIEIGKGLAGYVAETGNPIRAPDGQEVPKRSSTEPHFRTALSVPLFSQERVIGVLNLYDKEEGLDFSEADMGTVLALADQAGVAIENVLLHREAQKLAIMDGLTAIWNHRYFQMQFEQELERAARFRRPFSLIVLDIDDFKGFNDTYGHQLGDFVLIELARRVKSVIRDIDMFARYGGEEFELLLPETDAEGGMRTAEKIRAAVADTAFEGEMTPKPLKVTISVGVACFPQAGTDRSTIFRAADLAMYTAKSKGKNQVVLHRPDEAA